MSSVAAADPITTLTKAFDATLDAARSAHANGHRVVLVSWPAVPIECLLAAGLVPFVVRAPDDAQQASPIDTYVDAALEANVFSPRIRTLVHAAIAGDLSFAARLVIPRTSDEDYKCFLYLRELERTLHGRLSLPEVQLFDLLQSRTETARHYARERTRAFLSSLEAIAGRTVTPSDLHATIADVNRARLAARGLWALRGQSPRVHGSVVLPLLGASWRMPPAAYATLVSAAVAELQSGAPIDGPRIFIAGGATENARLHRAIESHGAVVVSETGPWSCGFADSDVPLDGDPIDALADKYLVDSWSARQPIQHARRRFDETLANGVDGVVFRLPPIDSVFGWDYPRDRATLDSRGIPSIVLSADDATPVSQNDHERLAAFVETARQIRERSRRG